jgi:hypothetical protein
MNMMPKIKKYSLDWNCNDICCLLFFLLHNLIYVSNRGNLHSRTVFVHFDSDFILFSPSQKYVWSWLNLKFLKIFIEFSNMKCDSKCVVPNRIMYSKMDRVIVISSPLEWKLDPKNEVKPDVKLTVGCHQHCYCNICQIILNVLTNFTNFHVLIEITYIKSSYQGLVPSWPRG